MILSSPEIGIEAFLRDTILQSINEESCHDR